MPTLGELQQLYNLPSLPLGGNNVLEWSTDGHGNVIGAVYWHHPANGGQACRTVVWFDVPEGQPLAAGRQLHAVVHWQPFELSAPVRCNVCGLVVYLRHGTAVPVAG